MSEYDNLKKVIPPDQALANQALARSLQQVKKIFDTTLPAMAQAVSVLESNKDLNLINSLTTPLPSAIANFWANSFPTGTGPGNTMTTNDVIGIAAGATVNDQLPIVTGVINQLDSIGALTPLTGNGGAAGSVLNGVYTIMEYCLNNAYGPGPVVLPTTNYFTPTNPYVDIDDAFGRVGSGLIAAANTWIANIATTNSNLANQSNQATDAMANQMLLNQNNLVIAGVDVANVVIGDWANANIQANQVSAVLSLTLQLHDIGLDITEGGSAQFFEQVANTTNVTGQAVIASMREGRNIAVLNSAGIAVDTQLSDINPHPQLANNLVDAQYTVSQATANIII